MKGDSSRITQHYWRGQDRIKLSKADYITNMRLTEAMQLRQAQERMPQEPAMEIIGRFVLFVVIVLAIGTTAGIVGHWLGLL